MIGVYLYAVVKDARRFQVGCSGLPNSSTPVTTLPVGSLAAVVSECREYAPSNLTKAELLRDLAIHQGVIERLMQAHRALPVKFGTVLESRASVRAALAGFQHRLLSAFEQIGDSTEIEVAATWDLGRVFAEIGQEPEIAALAAAVAEATGQSEHEALVGRVRVGEMVKESLERQRAAYRERVMTALVNLVVDVQPNLLLNDEMVMNVAFLIERSKQDAFFAQIQSLDQSFDNSLNFRCIGPLPPYSFATVNVVHPRCDRLRVARGLLQLGEQVSEDEINGNYRRLAALSHPDRNQGDPTAGDRFARLAEARALLLEYVRALNAGGDSGNGSIASPERRVDLSAAAARQAPLLAISRSQSELVNSWVPSRERVSTLV